MNVGQIDLAIGGPRFSRLALGFWRLAGWGLSDAELLDLIRASLDLGITTFDHADIYGAGKSEEIFARAMAMLGVARETVVLQSKCGIRDGMYDFSREHIVSSTEGILRRLEIDYLDILLLHRPDTLMEPDEVADAFESLESAGKVKYFGVSNMNPGQIDLLRRSVSGKLYANQLQLSLARTGMIDSGFNVNMMRDSSVVRDGGILEYCRLNDITIQPWSPFQHGFFEGVFLGSEKYPELNSELEGLAAGRGVDPSAIAVAWLLRHPAMMQPIVGTTNAERLKRISEAAEISLDRREWYALYRSAGNALP